MTWWADFQFLRPFWLLLLPMAIFLLFRPVGKVHRRSPWEKAIDPHLLPYLMQDSHQNRGSLGNVLLSLFFALVALALSGPTVKKIPTDVGFNKAPLIICLELSNHMLSKDIDPSRLERAKFKLIDLLGKYGGAEIALIAFAGDAHIVVPLSDDYNTILTLTKSLTPDIMPVKGHNIKSALDVAQGMVERNPKSQILIMTSSHIEENHEALTVAIRRLEVPVLVWAFATVVGAPLLSIDGRFNERGDIKISKREDESLAKLTSAGATLINFTPDSTDVNAIVERINKADRVESKRELYFDTWYDLGPYFLALAMIVFLSASFLTRDKWWLLMVLLALPTPPVQAGVRDWFIRKDQQAQTALEAGDAKKAAELFEDDFRKGSAYYRAKMYDEAILHLRKVETSDGHYNLGNAYAQKGQFSEAIEAYNQALKLDAHNKDAKENKELLENQQQQQQQSQSSNQQQEKPSSENEQNQNHGEQTSKEQSQSESKNQTSSEQQKEGGQKKEQEADHKESSSAAPEKQNQLEEGKNAKKEQEKPQGEAQKTITPPDGQQKPMDPETRYYLERLNPNNSTYFKQKFLYESQQHKE
jgi:Ca-activated chloride channel family protein